jgi:6-phosphofructokinase 1
MQAIRRIAVVTSGGDAPGMNAAIRAVVRAATDRGIAAVGIRCGFAGLLEGCFEPLDERAVGGILQRGGTILGSARCPDFHEPETQRRGLDRLAAAAVDGIVVIGGNGSQ